METDRFNHSTYKSDQNTHNASPLGKRVNDSSPRLSGSSILTRDIDGHFCSDSLSMNSGVVSTSSTSSGEYVNTVSFDGQPYDGPIPDDTPESHPSVLPSSHNYENSVNGPEVMDDQSQSPAQTPIAVCGMALRLPASLKTPQQLWEFLLAGGDARGVVPSSRYNVASFHDPTGKHGTVITEYGYYLDDDIGALDASFFSMPRMEVERTDPQQRLMLEITRECFEDAGEVAWKGKRIGCYMGSLGEDWCEMFARETQNWGPYRYTGFGDFTLSNRVSYEMDLQGPSMTTRTACSSSLVALHEACGAISRGDCDSAVVGGANLIMTPGATMSMTEQNVLSKDGSCKTFSAEADGYARGEAIAAIFIKRVDHALRDGNSIRAVIKGTATNHNGKTPGMTVPSAQVQETLMRRAYHVAGIVDLSKTGFVECHGTGTPVGDPIESAAVARVFGLHDVHIGSIKPNFGHTEGASGLLSVIKIVLALENRIIPPNIKFGSPNPAIPFQSANLTVPTKPTAWPHDRDLRASVNSFGVGGTNAHAVIEAAVDLKPPVPLSMPSIPQLLLFSAKSERALTSMTKNYRDFMESKQPNPRDLAFTLANRREHFSHRTYAIGSNSTIGLTSPIAKPAKPPRVVTVFTGQGAQWPRMGRELMDTNPLFLNSIRRLDKALKSLDKYSPEWQIETELRKLGKLSRVHSAEFAQPLCTAIQIALIDILAALGIQPDAVVGHSSGEIAAAYAAGALTAEEAIVNAFHRGAVTKLQKQSGAMAALGMGWEEAEKYLVANVTIACDNAPKSVTISGNLDPVEAVVASVRKLQPDVMVRKLQVNQAYHSHLMTEVGEAYSSRIESRLSDVRPIIPFFSSVTGNLLDKSTNLDPKYWQRNLESPVLFKAAVCSILEHPIAENCAFLEIGPHSALSGPLRQILTQKSCRVPYASTLIRNQSCVESFLSSVGKLWSLQVPIDLEALIPSGECLSGLPSYPWDHEESYWYESRLSKDFRQRKHPHHDLLGARVMESTDQEPSWRNVFHLNTATWVRDHKVGEDIVFPFAGYVAMAGEAVLQMTGIPEAFRLRHIIVSTALVVPEGKPTEIVTTLRQHRLTDTLNSKWWDFSITSHNGHTWIKHCTGEAMTHSDTIIAPQTLEGLPRRVETRKWFENLSHNGLDLGPAFRNLENISASTTEQNARGMLLNSSAADGKYYIHPTVIDSALQLIGIASTSGEARKFRTRLPTSCDTMSITRCHTNFCTEVSTSAIADSVIADALGIAEGCTVLSISGLKLTAISSAESLKQRNTHGAARQEWVPDVDFQHISSLVQPAMDRSFLTSRLESLSHLCLVLSQRYLAEKTSVKSHLQKFHEWIELAVKSLDVASLMDLSNEYIDERIDKMVSDLAQTPASAAANALRSVCCNIGAIFSMTSSYEDVLSNEIVSKLYNFAYDCDVSSYIKSLCHCEPNLRVLELGSWNAYPSRLVVNSLTQPRGNFLCSKYTFATKGFISPQELGTEFPNFKYATLDVQNDPFEQGFEGQEYDLVIANNIIHKSQEVRQSLNNIRKLLHPTGRLLLQEFCPGSTWMKYISGAHHDWWSRAEDDGFDGPYLNNVRWQEELLAAGYEVGDTFALDTAKVHQQNYIMSVRPSIGGTPPGPVTLLCQSSTSGSCLIAQQLESQGYEVHRCTLEDSMPPDQDVIALLDINEPFFENIEAPTFEKFKAFLQKLKASGVFWVTRLSQMHCTDPRFAQAIGAARTFRSELLIDFTTCEVDCVDSSATEIVQVFTKFQKRGNNKDFLTADMEYAIFEGVIYIGRFFPFDLSHDLRKLEPSGRAMLDLSVPGQPSTLHWTQKPALAPLQPDEVEVEISAVGLNFRDVLIAMNIVQLPQGRVFGLEGSGIVRRVGTQVEELRVGDRVAVVEHSMFATSIVTLAVLCVRIPDHLHFHEASTMFFPYITAMHSLVDIGGLQKGQSVLIHSACGGVGLAAIQLAQMIGAEVYATVGTEQKVSHLMSKFGIPKSRIFSSRDESFVEDIKLQTEGNGVDVVLNSLSGELLHATWRCVAPFGKMVEIGKRDLLGFGKLDMSVFLANRSYCCVDADAFRKKPAMMRRLLNLVMEHFLEGRIAAITPIEVFDAASPYNAFKYMQPGQHIGRICMSLHNHSGDPKIDAIAVEQRKPLKLDDGASFLLVGGLGGLGRAVSTWMVEHGARHLSYLSRSAGSGPNEASFILELNSMGCEVQIVQGSVSKLEDVVIAIKRVARPLRGILQMSMVLRDENFLNMTLDQWNATNQPKIQGTWNLHNASVSENLQLDFFVLFSSLSGTIGQPGQANYASGNTFQDAFVQYRTNLGLPASAIDIGAVADVGYIAENPQLLQKMAASGFEALKEQEVLDGIEVAMTRQGVIGNRCGGHLSHYHDPNTFVLGLGSSVPLDSPKNRAIWRKDRRMAIYHNTTGSGKVDDGTSSASLKSYIASTTADPSILKTGEAASFFAREIGKRLFTLLLKPEEELDVSLSLVSLGMDSLVGIELRSWWKQAFGYEIGVLEMLGMGTLEALGRHAAEGLMQKATSPA